MLDKLINSIFVDYFIRFSSSPPCFLALSSMDQLCHLGSLSIVSSFDSFTIFDCFSWNRLSLLSCRTFRLVAGFAVLGYALR